MTLKQKDIDTFKEVLMTFEKRSTCVRLHVAALLIKDGRIISSAYNGVQSKALECKTFFANNPEKIALDHHDFAEKYEIHAEMNAIAIAAKEGICVKNTVIVCSIVPCCNCGKLIIASGIKEVYYVDEYDRNTFGKNFLLNSNIELYKI